MPLGLMRSYPDCQGPPFTALRNRRGPFTPIGTLTLIADSPLSEISRADVLLVPGAGNATTLRNHPEILAWVRKIHKTTTWTTSVCTGSLILGAAEILSGVRATTHWAVFDRLNPLGAIPTYGRVVEDGKIMTAAGVSAGIDMALQLAAKLDRSPLCAGGAARDRI